MPNALSTPPTPAPEQQQQGQQQGNALQGGGGSIQASPVTVPAPDHKQTVALLRHFDMIGKELNGLIKNPNLGKADIRSDVIDAVTRLVSDRVVSATQGVAQMGALPDKPFEQKTWLAKMIQQNMQARAGVLQHHAAAYAGAPPEGVPKTDDHMDTIQGAMASHYPGNK